MIVDSYVGLSRAVLCIIGLYLLSSITKKISQKRLDERFAASHGCQPPKKWLARWPLGLDMVQKAFRYAQEQRILQFFVDVVEETGPTFEQDLLGARAIDTVDPKVIEAVLSTQFREFGLGLRSPIFAPLLGDGIFTQDGESWQHSRELLRPQFMSNRAQNFEQIQDCVNNLIDVISTNDVVDLQPLFFRLTFDTTTFLLFGKQMSSLKTADVANMESNYALSLNMAQDYLAQRGRLGQFYWLLGGRAFYKACKSCHEFVDEAVQQALSADDKDLAKSERQNYIFLEALIQQTREPKVLRDQCLNILLAGRDTTACCLSWTFRLLVRHQDKLTKLRAEIESIAGLGSDSPLPTIAQLKKMSYLNLVLKEGADNSAAERPLLTEDVLVLRLYPSVPVNSRECLKTTVLPTGGGEDGTAPILVRRGEGVGYCVYAMHRRRDLYGDDAHEFRPERWENDQLKDIGWGYLPFNDGPRICLGMGFALLEAGYTVARMIQCFPSIQLADDEDTSIPVGREKQVLTLVLACADGCRVRLSE